MPWVTRSAPPYNRPPTPLPFPPPVEVDQLMDRSFGQYQRRNAVSQLDDRVGILRRRLQDLEAEPSPCCGERTIASYLHSKEAVDSLRGRLRRDRRAKRRGALVRRGGGPGDARPSSAGQGGTGVGIVVGTLLHT